MASGPITSWQIDRETVETVADFIFLASKIAADGDGSREIKRCLLLRRKVMINLDCIYVYVYLVSLQMMIAAMKLKDAYSLEGKL